MKPSIRKLAGVWTVTRPGYGFGAPTIRFFESWKAACASLRSSPGSAGQGTERGVEHRPVPWFHSVRDAKGPVPIRMEDT